MKDHAVEHRLDTEGKAARALVEALRAADMGDDEELAADMVEGETGLMEALDAADAEIVACGVIVEGCKAQEAALKARRDRAEARAEKVRAAIEQALAIAEVSEKIVRPTATFTMTKRLPALVIDDESQIPAEFFKAVPKLDKAALKDAAETRAVPGCHMTNGAVTLTIRRK